MTDIKSIVDKNKVKLEKKATDRFGTAVDDFKRGGIPRDVPIPDSRSSPAVPTRGTRNDGTFYASSYAAALAGGTSFRPKLKFLFKVEFIFTPEALAAYPEVLGGAQGQDFTFLVRSVDRPKIDFEYEDDVNMYNFRTKVLKKIRHRELTITFMDDVGNRVIKFFRALMMIHSPITRRQLEREGTTSPPDPNSVNTGHGMMFSPAPDVDKDDTAIRGTFNSHVGNIISTIRVKQMFVDPSEPIGNAMKEVIFDFLNARLVSFDLDDLNHETSDVNLMTMQFDYDWMEIVDTGSLSSPDSPEYSITVPGITGAPIDASPAGGGGGSAAGNGRGPLPRSAPKSISTESIERSFQSNPGMGLYSTNVPTGVIGAASRSLESGATRVVNQAGAAYTDHKNLILPPSTTDNVYGDLPSTGVGSMDAIYDSAEGGDSPIDAIVSSRGMLS